VNLVQAAAGTSIPPQSGNPGLDNTVFRNPALVNLDRPT
jgi:hypothetical protein